MSTDESESNPTPTPIDAPASSSHSAVADGSGSASAQMKRRPLTLFFIVISVAWTGWIQLSSKGDGDWRRFGISDGFEVFSGDYWTLFTSIFVHVGVMHLFFNSYWTWILGGYVEERFGWRFYTLLMLIGGVCGSALELSFAGSTGVGLSGAVYGLFGFLWGLKVFGKESIDVLPAARVQTFLVWLVLCIVLTATGLLSVGNVAHVTGLVVGLLAALSAHSANKLRRLAIPLLVAFCGVVVFYSPWSYVWLASKAARAHEAERWDEAETYYSRMIERRPDDAWALENRGQIRIFRGREAEGKKDLSLAEQAKQKDRSGR